MRTKGMWHANPGILFPINESRNLRAQRQCQAERNNLLKTADLWLNAIVGLAKTGRMHWGYGNRGRDWGEMTV
jgi:hypothetical protein